MLKKITCVVLSIMVIIALSGCSKENKINEYDKETDINVGNGVENQYEEVTDNLNNSQEPKVNIEENKTNILSDKKQVVEGIKIDDVTSEEELEIKIKEYLSIFSHDWEIGFPKFNDINQLDEMWIWNAVKKYAGQKLNSFTDRKFTKKDLEEIKVGLFGKQLKKEVPEKTREFSKREGCDEYYWNDVECYEFTPTVYVKKVERNGKKIVAEVIPYMTTYILAEENDADDEKIYNLNSECVIEETIVGEWEDTHKIIEKYQDRFPRNIIEFEVDEVNGNLNIVSCKIIPENINNKNDIKIDDELVQIIMENLNNNSHKVPLDNEKIYQYKYSELETGELWEYLFDIDNDGIEDKIKIDYGTAVSFCEIFFGIDNTTYIRGNYNGGIYDETIPLSERDETEGQIVHLEFFRHKNYNYILDYSTTTANCEIRLYHNKELVDVVNIRNKKNKEYSVTVCKENDLEEILKNEGEKILKEKECNYPYFYCGNGETDGESFNESTTDINNDGELEKIHKGSYGGFGQFFSYSINADSEYFEKLGICKNTLYGFWIDNINNINVLKMIEYDWDNDIAYFRCYIAKNENADLIFEMRRKDNLTFLAE